MTEQVRSAETTMVKIDAARESYRPCGLRSAIMYFVLNDFAAVDPMYQFSLDAYEKLFIMSIEKSSERNSQVNSIEDRIEQLNDYHTLATYKYACRGLFERHKMILSLHIATKVLRTQGDLNEIEFNFFLRGGQVMDRASQP